MKILGKKGFVSLAALSNFNEAKNNRQKTLTGFTLIELLVVVAIIGILSSIVMVSLNSATMKARDAKRISDINQLKMALQIYENAYSAYPANLDALKTGGFIGVIPVDPVDGSPYQYCLSPTLGYHLGTRAAGLEGPIPLGKANILNDGCASGSFSGADPVYDVVSQ